MKNRCFFILLLALTVSLCSAPTEEVQAESTEIIQNNPSQDNTPIETNTESADTGSNTNPFLDTNPMMVDCLTRIFGEERYKELQNERPTPEEEQRMSECYGGPASGDQGGEAQNDDEFCKLDPDAPQCGGEYLGYRMDIGLRGYTSGVCNYTAIVLELSLIHI